MSHLHFLCGPYSGSGSSPELWVLYRKRLVGLRLQPQLLPPESVSTPDGARDPCPPRTCGPHQPLLTVPCTSAPTNSCNPSTPGLLSTMPLLHHAYPSPRHQLGEQQQMRSQQRSGHGLVQGTAARFALFLFLLIPFLGSPSSHSSRLRPLPPQRPDPRGGPSPKFRKPIVSCALGNLGVHLTPIWVREYLNGPNLARGFEVFSLRAKPCTLCVLP